jgi:hypothetical protein
MSTQQQTTPKQHVAEHGKVVIEEEKEAGTKVRRSERLQQGQQPQAQGEPAERSSCQQGARHRQMPRRVVQVARVRLAMRRSRGSAI